ncbi:hypothetical protein [Laspinema palackyanum]|uniref:hypothetical protein n=1 Tax=Laspinema palackyanum TaxID=3231601 RepID=UPI00345D3E9A|nr:hypothetical protein [Laspinema sp. D2c]
MKPEKLIADFLNVWDNQPEVFEATGAMAGLESLNAEMGELEDLSNPAIATKIEELCEAYSGLAEAIIGASRKPKPKPSESAQSEKVLDNRFPKLSQVLRERDRKDSSRET